MIQAPGYFVIDCQINETIKIAGSANFAGSWGFLTGASPTVPALKLPLASGTTFIGPWPTTKRIRIDASTGGFDASAEFPPAPFCILLGKIEALSANYTLSETDNGRLFRIDATSAVTITVPNNLPAGFNVSFAQWNTGAVTIAPASGASNRSGVSALSAQFAYGALVVMKNIDGVSAEFILGGSFA
jgi:hypothetical protein